MAAKIHDINHYYPGSSDLFFFDNNIWMYLFCPLGNHNRRRQQVYSSFLQQTKSANSTIFTSSLVLSEFCNSFIKLDFDLWKKETKNYSARYKEEFVGTSRYLETVELIKQQIKKIMKLCEKSSDNFNAVNLDQIFSHFLAIDFNDSYYIELAKLGNWKIVTDDRDFQKISDQEIEIITIP